MSNCVDIDLDKSLIEQIYDLQQENQELKQQLEYYTPDENAAYFKGKDESKMKINRLRSENKELKKENQKLKEQLSNSHQMKNQQKMLIEKLNKNNNIQ